MLKEQVESSLEWIKKGKEIAISEETDFSPNTVFFFEETVAEPVAFIALPQFEAEEKPEVYRLAFGCLKIFQTPRIAMVSDVWTVEGDTQVDLEEWYAEGKSLSEHPNSVSALMVAMYDDKHNCTMSIVKYGIDDKGKLFFKDDELEFETSQTKEVGGLVPDIVSQAYNKIYNRDEVVESKFASQYLGMLYQSNFEIGMSDMMFESLGIDNAVPMEEDK